MQNDSSGNGAIFICLLDGVSGKLDIMWTPALSSAFSLEGELGKANVVPLQLTFSPFPTVQVFFLSPGNKANDSSVQMCL